MPRPGPSFVTLPRRKPATLATDEHGRWRIGGALRAARTTAVTSAAGLGRPRRWPAGLAWGLWTLAMLGVAVVPWMDSLLRQAGRPDLAALVPGNVVGPVVAMLSAATVGALLASRRPRHPVGWLLLGFALSLTASGVTSSSVTYGLVARPGALPAANVAARLYPVTIAAALAVVGFVLLLTPTGSPPSSRWRRWALGPGRGGGRRPGGRHRRPRVAGPARPVRLADGPPGLRRRPASRRPARPARRPPDRPGR